MRPLPLLFAFALAIDFRAASADDVDLSKLPAPAANFDFHKDIRPILEANCVGCHGAVKQKGKFRLDTRDWLRKGGENGEVIKGGRSAESPLIHFVARLVEDMEMPPKKERALKPEQVALLRSWIDADTPWPEGFVLHDLANDEEKLDPAEIAKIPPAVERKIDFVNDVQPIFRERCYQCHGAKRQEAAFRLDHKATVLAGGELGRALVPGKSAESLLIHFVAGLRPEGKMPRKGEPLSAEQIGILRAWIDQGADFPDAASVVLKDSRTHWAFQPPVKPAVPAIAEFGSRIADWEKRDAAAGKALRNRQAELERWPLNPIDNFVLARLLQEGLAPSPPAAPETLCRRLYLDLVGLPPTPAQLDAFTQSAIRNPHSSEEAAHGTSGGGKTGEPIRNLTDSLLSSPHYGERWARHWLDAARYADTNGYEKDAPRIAHFYRDWVIGAFNRDLPYNQFIIEQLAGDQLPQPTQDQIVATGYLRNSMINEEGGVDPEQFRMEAMFDRMDAIGKGILGLTIQCAQCHNHKYDPITQQEYYRIFAFLNNDHEAQPRVYAPDETMRRADLLRQIGEIEAKLKETTPDWEQRLTKWEEEWRARPKPQWTVFQPEVDKNTTGGQRYLPQTDGSFLAGGYQPTKSSCTATWKTDVKGITAFRIEMLHDPNLPANGPGRSFMGTFGLTEFSVEAGAVGAKKASLKFAKATADLEAASETTVHPNFNEKQPVRRVIGPVSYAIDGKDDTAWSSDLGPGRRNAESEAVFLLEKPIAGDGATEFVLRLKQNHGGWNSDDLQGNNLGRFRLSYTTTPDTAGETKAQDGRASVPASHDPVPRAVREILAVPREKRTPAQFAALFCHWRTLVPEWKDANAQIEALWKQHPEGTTQMTLATRNDARLTNVLKRGDWLKPSDAVQPGVPAILNPLPTDAPPTRLTFARWIADAKAPTTARAFVNRVWQAYFGTGLVATSEDFGIQSEPPSHPELLDWLACEFMENGWSVKHLHRLIVGSATYQQSSRVSPELHTRDPYNRLLARGPRFRVEGEIVHDIQLAVAGLLNPKIGGRAVMPPAPEFLFQPPTSYAPYPWKTEVDDERHRRAIYTLRRRTTPYPALQTFDAPEGNTACVRRGRSNTPLQALIGLNETLSMDAARALAARILAEGGSDDAARIEYAFRRCLSRPAAAAERDALLALLAKQKVRISEGWIDAWLLATGRNERPAQLPANTTPAQLAAYTVVSRVLLNLDETITKE